MPSPSLVLDISAHLQWNETGLWMEAGKTYTFSASGEWLDSTIACDPDGTADGQFQPAEAVQLMASAGVKWKAGTPSCSRTLQAIFALTNVISNTPGSAWSAPLPIVMGWTPRVT